MGKALARRASAAAEELKEANLLQAAAMAEVHWRVAQGRVAKIQRMLQQVEQQHKPLTYQAKLLTAWLAAHGPEPSEADRPALARWRALREEHYEVPMSLLMEGDSVGGGMLRYTDQRPGHPGLARLQLRRDDLEVQLAQETEKMQAHEREMLDARQRATE